jgi:hypothetical protein
MPVYKDNYDCTHIHINVHIFIYTCVQLRHMYIISVYICSGWSRVLYSTEVKLFPWIPEFVITFLTKTALIEVSLYLYAYIYVYMNAHILVYVYSSIVLHLC